MKTAGKETPNNRTRLCSEPSPWGGRPEASLLMQTGWGVRKNPAAGEVFFLIFPFIELIRTWPTGLVDLLPKWPRFLGVRKIHSNTRSSVILWLPILPDEARTEEGSPVQNR